MRGKVEEMPSSVYSVKGCEWKGWKYKPSSDYSVNRGQVNTQQG